MKKTTTTLIFALAFCFSGWAQLNMELLSQVEYGESLNDIWGWADPETGIEYALVGLRNGVSIVSLEDPENATQVAYIPGPSSTWRDLKTWGNFCYVTNETSNGLLVIDMSNLPEEAPYFEWTPTFDGLGTLSSCHNLYIDENGYCYLAGCNLNNGGMLILDVTADDVTGEPEFVSAAPPVYAHDVYVVSDRMYSSEIYVGAMAIYDVADKNNIEFLASQTTPFQFTHNIWLNDDESVAFTTDERNDAPVAAYDITDLDNIQELDRYNPIGSLGTGVIPHNVHVWDDYLLISYYADGGRIVDASRPENLIEVGNYDTWLGGNGGFDGAWGLYPFLPSQTVLVSDIGNGLYVLQPNFVRACWLEGLVTDEDTGDPLFDVTVEIDSEQPNLGVSDINGRFETGQALAGSFEVTFKKAGYEDEIITVDLVNGEVTEVEVQMTPLGMASIQGTVVREDNGAPIPGAKVLITGLINYEAVSDASGNFAIQTLLGGTYDIYAAQWGYLHAVLEDVTISGDTPLTVELGVGYQDDFFVDLGWEADETVDNPSENVTGGWVLGEPVGTDYNGPANPDFDVDGDIGQDCYVTGNGGGQGGTDDIDNATVVLTSPVIDLSTYDDPVLSFSFWFFNDGGGNNSGPPNDNITVTISNGQTEVDVVNQGVSLSVWREITDIHIGELIELTDNMHVTVTTGDQDATGHIVEAAFDQFLIEEMGMVNSADEAFANVTFEAFPNPFSKETVVDFRLNESYENAFVSVYNAFGQLVEQKDLQNLIGQVRVGNELPGGIYWVKLEIDGQLVDTVRIVKAN